MDELQKLEQHVQDNPTDYEAVVELYKARSDAIAQRRAERRKRKQAVIEACRRFLDGE